MAAACFFGFALSEAKAAVQVTTLDNTVDYHASIQGGANALGFAFTVDNQDYVLDSATALLSKVLGGLPLQPSVSLFAADGNGMPTGISLVSFIPGSIDIYPARSSTVLVPTSSFILEANKSYVLTIFMPAALPTDSYEWWYCESSEGYGPSGTLWSAFDGLAYSSDGGVTWSSAGTTGLRLNAEISATPVPEPSSLVLAISIGGAALVWRRRRNNSSW